MDVHSYDLGDHVVNGVDVTPVQRNYAMLYGDDGRLSQQQLILNTGIIRFVSRELVFNPFFLGEVGVVKEVRPWFESYNDRIAEYEGIILQIPGVPVFTTWSDCPQLLVAGEESIGIVHATAGTLDNHVLHEFFAEWEELENLDSTQIAFSPYITPNDFTRPDVSWDRTEEWIEEGMIRYNGDYLIDVKAMIMADLAEIGVPEENVQDAEMDSVEMSYKSHGLGGKVVSHRHSVVEQLPESRGGLVLMLKDNS